MDKEFLNQIDRVGDLIPEVEEKLDSEVLICECFCVSARDIREAFADTQIVDLQILQDTLNLGHGCQSCMKNKDTWIHKIF